MSKAKSQPNAVDLLTEKDFAADIINIASEAIISIDESERIILFNVGAEKIFGYRKDEILGQPLNVLIPAQYSASHRSHIAEFGASATQARMMGERQEIAGLRKNGQEFPAAASISKLKVGEQLIFTVVLRDITLQKEIEANRQHLIYKLQHLHELSRRITAELSLEKVLQKVVESAQDLFQTKYAALGIHDGTDQLSRFITAGISPAEYTDMGPLPVGTGLLKPLIHLGDSVIINDIAAHPDTAGFPKRHPVMQRLMGVPISAQEKVFGTLYVTDKANGTPFDETDQQLLEILALYAGNAIENARLYEQTERLAILEERDRFARDLHDGIIQSIYGVGLSLDNLKAAIAPANEALETQINFSLKSLAKVIEELRSYIFDLRPQALSRVGLKPRLESLIEELKVNVRLPIQAKISPDIDQYLTEEQAGHTFHISHEALSNAARHAKANHIILTLTREDTLITLQIKDDGSGFIPPPVINPGHRGLANIQARVSKLNAILKIDSVLEQGTNLTVQFRGRKKS